MDPELPSPADAPEDRPEEDQPENDAADSAENFATCPHCGGDLAEDAALCPDCKWPRTPLSPADRAAAAAAYLPLIPAVALLFLPAFRTNRFVRFHAWQSISLWVAFFILTIAALFFSNVAAAMVFLLFGILVSLA